MRSGIIILTVGVVVLLSVANLPSLTVGQTTTTAAMTTVDPLVFEQCATQLIGDYNALVNAGPEVSNKRRADEMFVRVKGKMKYLLSSVMLESGKAGKSGSR